MTSNPGSVDLPRVGFVLEQTLGHVTHAANLQTLVGRDPRVEARFELIEFEPPRWASRLPGASNWTVRAAIRARAAIGRLRRDGVDALFVHTQVPAILLPDVMRRIPTVVSLDATPIQYDELGAHYGHARGNRVAEHLKWRMNRACFARARHIVAWASWTKASLVDRYGVPAERITVIPPGVHFERWTAPERNGVDPPDRPIRVLFVGGDLARKGGNLLVDAIARLRHDGVAVELDLVTRDVVGAADGVRVHHGLGPNSSQLIELYHRADVFCLPTLGDCLPMVLSEAGAAGLPLVATDVGAIAEVVRDGDTGLLVRPGDVESLAAAIRRLATDPGLRYDLGARARTLVRDRFDAATNAEALVELLVSVARQR